MVNTYGVNHATLNECVTHSFSLILAKRFWTLRRFTWALSQKGNRVFSEVERHYLQLPKQGKPPLKELVWISSRCHGPSRLCAACQHAERQKDAERRRGTCWHVYQCVVTATTLARWLEHMTADLSELITRQHAVRSRQATSAILSRPWFL